MSVELDAEGVGDPALLAELELDADSLLHASDLAGAELSLLLVGDDRIRALNREWLGKDHATDVLSFPQEDPVYLGDLVISLPTARRQAAERGHGLRDELRILLVHGLLHLEGFDHERSEEEHARMAREERDRMGRLGWTGEGLIASSLARH